MLIVSNFHDYYDSILSFGIDKKIVYQRKTIDLGEFKNLDSILKNYILSLEGFSVYEKYPNFISTRLKYEPTEELQLIVIFLAGVQYKLIWLNKYCFDSSVDLSKDWFYKKEDLLYNKDVNENLLKQLNPRKSIDNAIKDYFAENGKKASIYNYLVEKNIPILSIRIKNQANGVEALINPCLKKFNFQKLLDPYTAFQNLYMFVGGVIGNKEKEIIKISDKDMIGKKGFDDKWSFRRQKQSENKRNIR